MKGGWGGDLAALGKRKKKRAATFCLVVKFTEATGIFFSFLKFYSSMVVYKIAMISTEQRSDSGIHARTHPFSFGFHSYIDCHRILGRVLCAM